MSLDQLSLTKRNFIAGEMRSTLPLLPQVTTVSKLEDGSNSFYNFRNSSEREDYVFRFHGTVPVKFDVYKYQFERLDYSTCYSYSKIQPLRILGLHTFGFLTVCSSFTNPTLFPLGIIAAAVYARELSNFKSEYKTRNRRYSSNWTLTHSNDDALEYLIEKYDLRNDFFED